MTPCASWACGLLRGAILWEARWCGFVVCDACSSARRVDRGTGKKKRCCMACADTLDGRGTAGHAAASMAAQPVKYQPRPKLGESKVLSASAPAQSTEIPSSGNPFLSGAGAEGPRARSGGPLEPVPGIVPTAGSWNPPEGSELLPTQPHLRPDGRLPVAAPPQHQGVEGAVRSATRAFSARRAKFQEDRFWRSEGKAFINQVHQLGDRYRDDTLDGAPASWAEVNRLAAQDAVARCPVGGCNVKFGIFKKRHCCAVCGRAHCESCVFPVVQLYLNALDEPIVDVIRSKVSCGPCRYFLS